MDHLQQHLLPSTSILTLSQCEGEAPEREEGRESNWSSVPHIHPTGLASVPWDWTQLSTLGVVTWHVRSQHHSGLAWPPLYHDRGAARPEWVLLWHGAWGCSTTRSGALRCTFQRGKLGPAPWDRSSHCGLSVRQAHSPVCVKIHVLRLFCQLHNRFEKAPHAHLKATGGGEGMDRCHPCSFRPCC